MATSGKCHENNVSSANLSPRTHRDSAVKNTHSCVSLKTKNCYAIVSSEPSYLTKESTICRACYKHLDVIKQNIKDGKVTTPNTESVCNKEKCRYSLCAHF